MRSTLRLPFRLIQGHLASLYSLRLSVRALVALTHDMRQQLQPQADQLQAAVQTSTVTHGDETSWRENGQNGYAWAFVTAGPAAVPDSEFDHSRSHLVAQRILRNWRLAGLAGDRLLCGVQSDPRAASTLLGPSYCATCTTSNRRRGPILKWCNG